MKLLPAIAFIISIATSFAVSAQEAAKPTIAVVNIQSVMRESTAFKSMREQLETKQKSFHAEITKKEETLQKEDKDLAKQQAVLSKEAFAEKVKSFRSKATEVQKEVQAKKSLLDASQERALGEIQKTVSEIIAAMAKEKGFIIAIPTSQIMYADEKLDISKEVLEKLNKKLPKIDVKFEK